MLDLLVIGAGYWGTAAAVRARERGLDVLLLDANDRNGASRNASGIVHPKTYASPLFKRFMPPEWSKADLQESFEWLARAAGAAEVEEHFENWDRPDLGVRRVPGRALYLGSNESLLGLETPTIDRVTRLERRGGAWVVNDRWVAANLIVAAGVWTDTVLALAGATPGGVAPLWGLGLLVEGSSPKPSPLVVQTRPYRKFETRPWGHGRIRVGDVANANPDDRFKAELRQVAREVAPGHSEVQWFEGERPTLEQFTVRLAAPHLAVATGGHRMGLGLAGLAARKALEVLGWR